MDQDDGRDGRVHDAPSAPATWQRAEVEPIDLAALEGRPVHELLRRFHDGDPLQLRGLAADRRDREARLVSTHRLFLRSVARAAYEAARGVGDAELQEWMEQVVDTSLNELVEEDRSGDRAGTPAAEPDDYWVLTSRLEVSQEEARRRCVAFNDLADDVRRAYFGLVYDGAGVSELARSAGVTEAVVRGYLAQALRALDPPGRGE